MNPANDREPASPAVVATDSRADLLSVAGAMLVGTAALMILGVQPVLLGALTEEHRLSVAALGGAIRIAAVLLLVSAVLFEATNWRVRATDPARTPNDSEVTSNEAY